MSPALNSTLVQKSAMNYSSLFRELASTTASVWARLGSLFCHTNSHVWPCLVWWCLCVCVSLAWLIILTHQQSCVMVYMTKALALHFVSTLTWNFQSEKCEVTCITSLVPPTKHLHYRQTDRHTHMETLDMAQDSSSWQLIFWCLAYKQVKWE